MLKFMGKTWGLWILLFIIVCLLSGCDGDGDCSDCDIPYGYHEIERFKDGDFKQVTYTNGAKYNIHYIICTSTDNGCTWDKAEYWSGY